MSDKDTVRLMGYTVKVIDLLEHKCKLSPSEMLGVLDLASYIIKAHQEHFGAENANT